MLVALPRGRAMRSAALLATSSRCAGPPYAASDWPCQAARRRPRVRCHILAPQPPPPPTQRPTRALTTETSGTPRWWIAETRQRQNKTRHCAAELANASPTVEGLHCTRLLCRLRPRCASGAAVHPHGVCLRPEGGREGPFSMPLLHVVVDCASLEAAQAPGAAAAGQRCGRALRRLRLRLHEALAALDNDPHERLLWR